MRDASRTRGHRAGKGRRVNRGCGWATAFGTHARGTEGVLRTTLPRGTDSLAHFRSLLSRNSLSVSAAAPAPGLHHPTGKTVRSIVSDASAAFQSTWRVASLHVATLRVACCVPHGACCMLYTAAALPLLCRCNATRRRRDAEPLCLPSHAVREHARADPWGIHNTTHPWLTAVRRDSMPHGIQYATRNRQRALLQHATTFLPTTHPTASQRTMRRQPNSDLQCAARLLRRWRGRLVLAQRWKVGQEARQLARNLRPDRPRAHLA